MKTNQIPAKEKEAGATTGNIGLRVSEFLLLPPSGQTMNAKCHAAFIHPSIRPSLPLSPRVLSLLVTRDVAANLRLAWGGGATPWPSQQFTAGAQTHVEPQSRTAANRIVNMRLLSQREIKKETN